jgi:hypothetical protein
MVPRMMTQPRLLLAVLAFVAAAFAHGGCGPTCPQVQKQRDGFVRRTRTTVGPDAHLTVPFNLLDRLIAGQLQRRDTVTFQIPTDKLGIPMPLALDIQRVRAHAAPAGRLGLRVEVAAIDARTNQAVLQFEADASVAPQLAVGASGVPELTFTLKQGDVGALVAPPGAVAVLGRWIHERLPRWTKGDRVTTGDEFIIGLGKQTLELIHGDGWAQAKTAIFGSAPLVDVRLTLPDFQAREVSLTTNEHALVAVITTDSPDAGPLLDAPAAPASERMVLRLSGGTAMGVINRAMERGQLAARFDDHGAARANGPWEARVAWRTGKTSPLVVKLWRLAGDCRRAEVSARCSLVLQGGGLAVSVADGRLALVAAPAFARGLPWLESLLVGAVSQSFGGEAFSRIESGERTPLWLSGIALGEHELAFDLDLAAR